MSDIIDQEPIPSVEQTPEQDNNTQKQPAEFNSVVRGIFIFLLITSAINCLTKLLTNLGLGNTTLGLIMFVMEAANCIFLYMMLQRKGWAVLALFGMLLLQIPLNLVLENPDMQSVYISTFLRIIVFSILLLIPKNGITGWQVLFEKNDVRGDGVSENDASNEQMPAGETEEISEDANQEKHVEVANCPVEDTKVDSPVQDKGPDPEELKSGVVNSVEDHPVEYPDNKGSRVPRWLFALIPVVLIGLVLGGIMLFKDKSPKKSISLDGPVYYYLEKSSDKSECVIHKDAKCKEGLVYVELASIYSGGYDESNFCSKCITPKQLRPILDSCRAYEARKEISEHISKFYEEFNKKYNDFDTEQEFREWLANADSSAIDKLYNAFNRKYDNFDGPNGKNEMIAYLGWKCPKKPNADLNSDQLFFHSVDVDENDVIISDADFARNRNNLVKVYSILKEEKYTDIGKNLDEFASMMSWVTNRKIAYEIMCKDYEMGTFEEFDERFYPATEEHISKEKDRRWLYRKLKEGGIPVGDYESFCLLLCYDDDLRNYYDQGIKLGLNLGSYSEYRKYIR